MREMGRLLRGRLKVPLKEREVRKGGKGMSILQYPIKESDVTEFGILVAVVALIWLILLPIFKFFTKGGRSLSEGVTIKPVRERDVIEGERDAKV